MRGEIADQYPGGDAQREADIEAGAARPARLILRDARAAVDRIEDTWRRMPPASAAATTSGAAVVVRGTAAAVLCWLTGRPVPAPADLAASRRGQSWPLPRLRPWS